MQNEEYDDIEEFDEDGIDCECDLDYDDEEDFEDEDDEDEKPKKKQKAPEKTVDDYLAVLRSNFDHVVWEERQDEWFDNITYQHLECLTFPSLQENINQSIEYVVWVSRDIRNEQRSSSHKEQLKYICDNLNLLRSKNEVDFLSFFEPQKMVKAEAGYWTSSKTGISDHGIYKNHTGMKKPTADDFAEKMKSIVSYVFENSPLDQKNDRFGRFDDYWFDTYAWNWAPFEQYKIDGIEPIVLFQLFAHPIRAYLGPRFISYSEVQEKNYVRYWIWSDIGRSWNDRNGLSHALDLINDTDIIEWLYAFTGWSRKEHDIQGETLELVVNHLRNRDRHKDIIDWHSHVAMLAKKARTPKELKGFLTDGIKYDANGGFGSNGFLRLLGSGGNHCLDHKIDYKVDIDTRYAKYLKIDESVYPKSDYGERLNVFDAKKQDIWEYVHNHYNPKPKVLDLFTMFDDEKPQVPANNTIEAPKKGVYQISLF